LRILPKGKVDSSGNYKLTTDGKDGAPPGNYLVYFEIDPEAWPKGKVNAPSTLPVHQKYLSPSQTPLRIEVTAGANPGKYDLVLSKDDPTKK